MAPVKVTETRLRLFLRLATKLFAAVAVVAVAAVALGYLRGGDGPAVTAVQRVVLADVAPGEAQRFVWQGRPIVALRRSRADWFVAFAGGSGTGCPVSWERAAGHFVDPCNGVRYDDRGTPIEAAGLRPLRQPLHHFDAAGRLVLGRD